MSLWIKSSRFTLEKLLYSTADSLAFAGGSMYVFRLAPQDYHRFHAPVTGTVKRVTKVKNTVLSVNMDAVQSGNAVLLNDRTVVTYDTQFFGTVAQVFIGATCVNSISTECSPTVGPLISNTTCDNNGTTTALTVGTQVTQGQDLGKFQFGGSCVVLVFKSGTITPDYDLLMASGNQVETKLQMGERIGLSASHGEMPAFPQAGYGYGYGTGTGTRR